MTKFPEKLTVGYAESETQYELVSDQVLVKIKPDTDKGEFASFLSKGSFQDEKDKEPDHKQRARRTLDPLGYRWVTMKKKSNSFATAKKALDDNDAVEEVRPIYYATGGGSETAATPLFEAITVMLSDDADVDATLAALQALGLNHHKPMSHLLAPLHYFTLDEGISLADALTITQQAQALDGVAAIEFDWLKLETYLMVPNDTEYANQWNMPMISAEGAWDVDTGDSNVLIAIIDSGFDLTHPDLAFTSNTAANPTHFNALEFLAGDPPPYNASSSGVFHGTACAGIAAASMNNNRGVVGIAGGCRIMPVRLGTVPSTTRVAAGLNWAANNGASVASLSLGTTVSMGTTNAIVNAWNAGMVICAATGNDGGNTSSPAINYPANQANVIAVGASNQDDERKRPNGSDGENWWGSQYGPELDVVAPGVQIWTTDEQGTSGYNPATSAAGGDYTPDFNGTSSATPLVAGLAGLIISANPSLSNQQVCDLIESTADKVSLALYTYANTAGKPNGTWNEEVGYGRINAQAALCAAVDDVTLTTASVVFNDVPAGETAIRAASFSIRACGSIDLQITAGPTVTSGAAGSSFDAFLGITSVTVPASPAAATTAQLWITYTGTSVGDTASGTMTVSCPQTGDTWVVPISANTVQRNSAAVMMVLDQSGSMEFDAGDGRDRIDVLHDSAPVLPALLHNDDSIGVVAFDHDAHDRMPLTNALAGGKIAALNEIGNHTPNPLGATSIGDGLVQADTHLAGVDPADFPTRAAVVLTDGRENSPMTIAAASGSVNSRVYAIGLGTPDHIDPAALTAVTNGTGGYVLMTGNLSGDEYFTLQKYYLQILAGVTNANVVLDPDGFVAPGSHQAIPFELNDVDYSVDIILLTPAPYAIRYLLITPTGDVIMPSDAAALGGSYVEEKRFVYYRLPLPSPVGHGAHGGKWQAILKVDDNGFKKYLETLHDNPRELKLARAHGVRYSLNVQTLSNLNLKADLNQKDVRPGSEVMLSAVLTEYGQAVKGSAKVVAQVTQPNRSVRRVNFKEIAPGQFEGGFAATAHGVFKCRLLAKGKTLTGRRFTREQILTASIYDPNHLAPDEDPIDNIDPGNGDHACAEKIAILIKVMSERSEVAKLLARRLNQVGVSYRELIDCLGKTVELMQRERDGRFSNQPTIPQFLRERPAIAELLRRFAAEIENVSS